MRAIILLVFALRLLAQDGLTITGGRPRIYFNPARLAQAQADYAVHPWTPGTMGIATIHTWAAHSLITNNPTECANAVTTAVNYTLPLQFSPTGSSSAADDPMRWFGEAVALTYDWCYPQMTTAQSQLLRDRWIGTTANATDPPHIPTDLASVAGSGIVTSASGPFLPNMAQNNMLVFQGGAGAHCPPSNSRYAILSVDSASQVHVGALTTLVGSGGITWQTPGNPANFGGDMSGCKARISGYVDTETQNTWGGLTQPYSNYFWGFWRNEILWSVAIAGESAYTTPLLDWALGQRWPAALALFNGATPWTTNSAKGGIWGEGTEYGLANFDYHVFPVFACQRFGRDLTAETNWFLESGYFTIYETTAAPTAGWRGNPYYQMFSWGDDEHFGGYSSALVTTNTTGFDRNNAITTGYSDVVSAMAQWFPATNASGYFRQYVQNVGAVLAPWLKAPDPGGSALPLSGLPLDYYAPGDGALFSRSSWTSSATQFKVSPIAEASGHGHADSGDFAIQRNGVWLTKEFTMYSYTEQGPGYSSGSGRVYQPTFSGHGLNDATSSGSNTTMADVTFCVAVVSTGAPDAFSWGTGGSCTNGSASVSMTGAAQNLSSGLAIKFNATTGHTLADQWVFVGQSQTTAVDAVSNSAGYAHNTVSFGPVTPTGCSTNLAWGQADGMATVQRLSSQTNYAYEVIDLTQAYKGIVYGSGQGNKLCRQHNPYVQTMQREYLFIKPLETLVIFDRLLSGSNYPPQNWHPVVAPESVVKTVYVHSPKAVPAISGNTATWDSFGERMKGWFFGPATPSLLNVDEGGFAAHQATPNDTIDNYSQRLEFSNAADVNNGVASAQSYMVTVLRAGDQSGWQDFSTATLVDNGSYLTLTLKHPTAGNAVWNIVKGATSSGGTFGYAASGAPVAGGLAETVKGPAISADGVVWPELMVATHGLADGQQFSAYAGQLSADNGIPPYRWILASGQLPKGLTLSTNGLISGTPLGSGSSSFQAQVSDSAGATASGMLSISVNGISSSMSMRVLNSSSSALLRLSALPGGGFGSAGCTAEVWPDDPADGAVVSVSDAGGAGTRYLATPPLTPGRTYDLYVNCGQSKSWQGVSMLPAGSGGTTLMTFAARPRVPGAVQMAVDFGITPNVLDQSVTAVCGPDCKASATVPTGAVIYYRRRWLKADGSTLASGGVMTVLAPGR